MAKKKSKNRPTKHNKKLGTAPGSIIYTGEKESHELFMESFDYSTEFLEEKHLQNIEEAFQYKSTETVSWINVNGLNHVYAIEKIGTHYNLHALTLEDIVNISQRPKIEDYGDYLFIVLKMLYYDADENLISEQVSFIVGNNYVLTFQESDGDVFDGVRERIRHGKGRIRTMGADYLLYALIDAVTDNYFVIIETMANKIEDLEDNLFNGLTEDDISIQIQNLKREVLRIRRNIFPLREIINKIEKQETPLIKEKTLHFFRDIYDNVIQISENLEIYREMIWSLMDMYMTTISNRMNEVMKVLTIIATIFIPLTFIAGIYGMNFDNIPELHYEYSYYILWGVMIILFVGMLVYFKRKKWL
ncbi:magnesium transporter [Pseudalgibacter alginicilyticus]|uniref:Magnesium transport protein CorA n=1 Tax=Pseudalgibacter alginicilyticus TaxID=1736674 RepID=A0A0P0D6K7_9FLAO|nr:magnesium/cobalt transporter CorA [Pseudalgibacter alginicilyticus]ALJ06559.1 magnesium transporter [Pseudalgibacter alginicilyticus]